MAAPSMAAPPAKVSADEGSASVLTMLEELIAKGKDLAVDEQLTQDAGLSPVRALRLRRKSKEVGEDAIKIMSAGALSPPVETRAFRRIRPQ